MANRQLGGRGVTIFDAVDLEILRGPEERGFFTDDVDLGRLGLDEIENHRRLQRLAAGELIRSFHLTLIVPPLLAEIELWLRGRLKLISPVRFRRSL